jgi:hypothetical protein
MRGRTTYANVAATLALVFSMTGGALAPTSSRAAQVASATPRSA